MSKKTMQEIAVEMVAGFEKTGTPIHDLFSAISLVFEGILVLSATPATLENAEACLQANNKIILTNLKKKGWK